MKSAQLLTATAATADNNQNAVDELLFLELEERLELATLVDELPKCSFFTGGLFGE